MPRYRLTLEYDGRPFAGWQRQENGPSLFGMDCLGMKLASTQHFKDPPPVIS